MAIDAYAPPRLVAEPTPVPLRFGLFSVALMPAPEPEWEAGVQWQPVACTPAAIAGSECTSPFGTPKTYRTGQGLIVAEPFVVYGSSACSPIGGMWELGFQRAMAHLLAGEERAVERATYLGEAGGTMSMVSGATTDITPTPGTAVTVTEGVALLELWLGANQHSPGVIRASRREATLMAAAHLLADPPGGSTGNLTTMIGTPVTAESGMTGKTSPAGGAAAAGKAWIFGTGRPVVRRSEPFMTPPERGAALDRLTNDLETLAERVYAVAWDCGTAAVLVNTVTGA